MQPRPRQPGSSRNRADPRRSGASGSGSHRHAASGLSSKRAGHSLRFRPANIRPEDQTTLQSNAQWLQSHPNTFITIEGHADERGDIVYNLALSDIRAQATHDALMRMGVPEKQIVFATGWGKLYPVCAEADESCWAQNRRSHFTLWGEGNGATSSGAASH